jgi:hypothetical protein
MPVIRMRETRFDIPLSTLGARELENEQPGLLGAEILERLGAVVQSRALKIAEKK